MNNRLFNVDIAMGGEDESGYSKKIQVPQYIPSDYVPFVEELYNHDKYAKLLHRIDKANLSDAERTFLKLAATRHIIFNYAKIADYYAHARKEVQELMEESALVILDINDAIANGYVKLSKRIEEICNDPENARKLGKDSESGDE